MNPTVRALVQRGFGTQLAETLHRDGYSVARLRQLSPEALNRLGIPPACQQAINGSRPPIPEKTLLNLLYKSSNTCCVCHDKTRGVIVHHIEPWAESRSHDMDNLVVLCPLCHDKAHTTRELTRGLTPPQLRHHKEQWLAESHRARTTALFTPKSLSFNGGFWDYINRQRLLDCANVLQIPLDFVPGYDNCSADDRLGYDLPFRLAGTMRYREGSDYSFLAHLLPRVWERQEWIDLDSIWTRRQIRSLLQPNVLVAITANHRFKWGSGPERGPGQSCTGYYTRHSIRLEFTFDPWDCMSSSSYTHHLRGQWVCTSLGFVRSINQSEGRLTIHCTCLGIGTGFTEYSGRTPVVAYTHGDAGADWEEPIVDSASEKESQA